MKAKNQQDEADALAKTILSRYSVAKPKRKKKATKKK
jgi:hypothetical protein